MMSTCHSIWLRITVRCEHLISWWHMYRFLLTLEIIPNNCFGIEKRWASICVRPVFRSPPTKPITGPPPPPPPEDTAVEREWPCRRKLVLNTFWLAKGIKLNKSPSALNTRKETEQSLSLEQSLIKCEQALPPLLVSNSPSHPFSLLPFYPYLSVLFFYPYIYLPFYSYLSVLFSTILWSNTKESW